MTQKEFDELPLLMSREQVARCGLPYKRIDELRVACVAGKAVPSGCIGALSKPGGKYFRYRKVDVAVMCGFKV